MNDAPRDRFKRLAAERALELVRDGMAVGIGTGSTARFFIEGLGRKVAEGLQIKGVPTSERSAELARAAGVPLLYDLDGQLDLAVDGADEIAPDLGLVKGRGGALVREKLVACAAQRFVVIADDSKLVPRLGQGALPVEVIPFLWRETARRIAGLGLSWEVRGGERSPFMTDNGNLVLDLACTSGIDDPARLAAELKGRLGVVDHGLFLGLAAGCIVAGEDGVRVLGHVE